MGYRSDVAYTIRFKNKEHRIRFMATAALNPEIELKDFALIDDETVLLSYEGVKWYDDYDWVKAHVQLLEDAKAQRCAWEFCRVGEEAGDTEQDGADGEGDYGEYREYIECPQTISIIQSLSIYDRSEPYPVGENLTKEDN